MANKRKRNAKRSNKNKRLNYSPNKLGRALRTIRNGEMSVNETSKRFGIPRTTLLYKVQGKRPEKTRRPGPECMLGTQNEELLVEWIQQVSKRGFPLTKTALFHSANELLKQGHGKLVNTFNAGKGPGRRWFEGFMRRHPTMTLRAAEYVHKGRAAVTEESIRKWFENIFADLKDHIDIWNDPTRIFNCDETGVVLHPKSRPVLATRGQKNVYDASGTCNKENMTVLITGSAAGNIAPPLALVSYKKIPSDIAATANPEWSIGRTENGWMTCQSFFEYIANVFEPSIKNIPKPVILFLDGHGSHISLQLSQFCLEKQIILVALPPNATHILQPLDVSFFGPLKKLWSRELENFLLTKKIEPRKCHVLPILENLITRPNFAQDLISGFRKCGLYPYNPDAVDYTKCLKIDENTMQENCTETQANNIVCDDALKQFELQLPISIKKQFDELGLDKEWSGSKELLGLFNFYKSLKYNLSFELLPGNELCTLNNSNSPEGSDISDGMRGIEPIYSPENETDFEFTFSNDIFENLEAEGHVDLDVSVTYGDIPDMPVPNDDFNQNDLNTTSTATTSTADTPSASVSCVENSNTNVVLDLSLAVPSNPTCNLKNTPVVPTSSEKNVVTPPTASSSTSSSSGKSVEEILNSIVRYKEKDSTPKKKNFRKQLKLPSVMTSQNWIALKTASEEEKNKAERMKEDRKKLRNLKQKEFEEKKKNAAKKREELKNSRVKERVKRKSPSVENVKKKKPVENSIQRKPSSVENSLPAKNPITEVIENPKEVEIGDWIVAEYDVPNSQPRRYIGNIFEVKNSRLFARFLRVRMTREFNGFVFSYPDVEDISHVKFEQIKKLLPPPAVYGRGLLKFNINSKDL